jgi:hypothetical protein
MIFRIVLLVAVFAPAQAFAQSSAGASGAGGGQSAGSTQQSTPSGQIGQPPANSVMRSSSSASAASAQGRRVSGSPSTYAMTLTQDSSQSQDGQAASSTMQGGAGMGEQPGGNQASGGGQVRYDANGVMQRQQSSQQP